MTDEVCTNSTSQHIHLPGGFSLVCDDTQITSVEWPRLQSLLAYLLLHRQSRTHLAFLLWPDSSETQAHTNLRTLLTRLRQALPNVGAFLQTDWKRCCQIQSPKHRANKTKSNTREFSKEAIVTHAEQNQLIVDIARQVIATTAQDELPLLRSISAAYFKNPGQVLKEQQSQDDILGFGIGEAVPLMTPYVLVITTQVLTFVTAEVQKSLATESANVISDLVKKLFKKGQAADKSLLALTPAQLAQVREVAYENARRLKLPDEQANLLADAIKGTLIA